MRFLTRGAPVRALFYFCCSAAQLCNIRPSVDVLNSRCNLNDYLESFR